jgi:hypothetical protein
MVVDEVLQRILPFGGLVYSYAARISGPDLDCVGYTRESLTFRIWTRR